MAGDWLKIEASTPEKAEVLAIAAALGWEDPDLAVGKLFKLWRWFDQHTTNGNASIVTEIQLDRVIGVTGFCNAVKSVGWLEIGETGVTLPRFDRHNGNTAKNRALTAKRVEKSRALKRQSNAEVTQGELPREEKNREDISTGTNVPVVAQKAEKKPSTKGSRLPADWRPTREYLDAALAIKPDMTQDWFVKVAHSFKDYWIAKSGKDAAKVDWLATFRNWARREAEKSTNRIPPKPNNETRETPIADQLIDRDWAR